MDNAARPEVDGMKKAVENKTEQIPRSTLSFLLEFFRIERLNRSANPDCLTASPMINEPTINHTTSSESEWYSNSGSPAFMIMMNTISAIATNPAGIFVVIHSVIAERKANKDTFDR